MYRILIIEKCQKRYLSARSNKANRVRINVNFNSCEAYVVKFKAKLKEFEYYTFYDSKTEYEEDKQANLIMLRKQLVSRALESMMGNSTSEIYAYMKPNTVIIPENIIKYVSAKEWRKKMYLNTLKKDEMYKSVSEIVGTNIETVKKFVRENADEIVGWHYDDRNICLMDLSHLLKETEIKQIDSLVMSQFMAN